MTRVVVVGSGIAGIVTAILASAHHEVVLVTKDLLAESNTVYAQGGIAAATAPDDSPALHAQDTLVAGAGHSDADAAAVLCEDGPELIALLLEWGVAFDRDGDDLARGLEAAHSRARILHAGGDATGRAIETALVSAIRRSSVVVRERTVLVDLLLSSKGAAARATGVDLLLPDGTRESLAADAVVLATGGAGQLYPHTSNPLVATGDGLAAALRAGARVRDLEFYQFHPTTLAVPGNFLVSEAVRGEGAVLRDATGERFMPAVHPDAELAPRDVVARAIAGIMARQNGLPVHLDARHLPADLLARRFPTITAACRRHGLDLATDLIPVTPAAHYWMGGIETDLDGRTSIPGLLAVGEVACTGVHGANRLASNSLLEGAVFARRAARALDRLTHLDGSTLQDGPDPLLRAIPASRSTGTAAIDRAAIQQTLWDGAGVSRDAAGLDRAARRLATIEASLESAPRIPITRESVENDALLTVGRALVAAASARTSSLGAHVRSDDPLSPTPATDDAERPRVEALIPDGAPC